MRNLKCRYGQRWLMRCMSYLCSFLALLLSWKFLGYTPLALLSDKRNLSYLKVKKHYVWNRMWIEQFPSVPNLHHCFEFLYGFDGFQRWIIPERIKLITWKPFFGLKNAQKTTHTTRCFVKYTFRPIGSTFWIFSSLSRICLALFENNNRNAQDWLIVQKFI